MREYDKNSIILSWEYNKLVQECIDISAAYSKSKEDDIFSKIILTKYDSDYLNLEIQRATEELYYIVSKYGITIDDSLQLSSKDGTICFEIFKPIFNSGDLACKESVIELIDHTCEQIIIKKSVIRWCYNSGIKDLLATLKEEIKQLTDTLHSYLYHLKRPFFTKAYEVQ